MCLFILNIFVVLLTFCLTFPFTHSIVSTMSKVCISFIFCCISLSLYSQISDILPSSGSIASASVADSHHWSAFSNPASAGYCDFVEMGLQYENKFVIKELSTKSAQLIVPNKLLNAGVSFSQFGYSLYHETLLGVALARNFGNKFAMGLQVNYYDAFSIATNSHSAVFLPQFGVSVRFSPQFNLGFQTFNPLQTSIKTEYVTKLIPSVFSLGTEYYFTSNLVWRTQIDRELHSNYRFATGFEYLMLDKITLKMGGYGADYLVPCMGVGFNFGHISMGLDCDIHPLLGLTTRSSVKYIFGSAK